MRYTIQHHVNCENPDAPDEWSVIDNETGTRVIRQESYTVCSNVQHMLNSGQPSGASECDEVANTIRMARPLKSMRELGWFPDSEPVQS